MRLNFEDFRFSGSDRFLVYAVMKGQILSCSFPVPGWIFFEGLDSFLFAVLIIAEAFAASRYLQTIFQGIDRTTYEIAQFYLRVFACQFDPGRSSKTRSIAAYYVISGVHFTA